MPKKEWVEMSRKLRKLEEWVCDVDADFYYGTACEVRLGGDYDDTVADILVLLSGKPAASGVYYCNHRGDRAAFYPNMTPEKLEKELRKEAERLKINLDEVDNDEDEGDDEDDYEDDDGEQ